MSDAVDRIALNELLDVMGDMYPTLVSTFEADARLRMEKMLEAVSAEDAHALAQVAHTFKGSAGNVCAVGLADALKQVEVCAKAFDFEAAKGLLSRIECLLIDVVICLNKARSAK